MLIMLIMLMVKVMLIKGNSVRSSRAKCFTTCCSSNSYLNLSHQMELFKSNANITVELLLHLFVKLLQRLFVSGPKNGLGNRQG